MKLGDVLLAAVLKDPAGAGRLITEAIAEAEQPSAVVKPPPSQGRGTGRTGAAGRQMTSRRKEDRMKIHLKDFSEARSTVFAIRQRRHDVGLSSEPQTCRVSTADNPIVSSVGRGGPPEFRFLRRSAVVSGRWQPLKRLQHHPGRL